MFMLRIFYFQKYCPKVIHVFLLNLKFHRVQFESIFMYGNVKGLKISVNKRKVRNYMLDFQFFHACSIDNQIFFVPGS